MDKHTYFRLNPAATITDFAFFKSLTGFVVINQHLI